MASFNLYRFCLLLVFGTQSAPNLDAEIDANIFGITRVRVALAMLAFERFAALVGHGDYTRPRCFALS